MTVHNYSNTASRATLDSPLNSSASSFALSTFTGYPSVPFYILMDRDTSSSELMEVTNVAGSTLTVNRGQGGTAATSHSAGAFVEHVIPAAVPQAVEQHVEATSNIHGITGALVGADSTGTLSNKTFQGAFVHSYSSSQPESPEAGFVVNADNGTARDAFVVDGDGANTDRRGFLITQNGGERFEAFNDGTVRVTPSGSAIRPGIESTTSIRTSDLEVTDDVTVAGDVTIAGSTSTAGLATGNMSASGTLSVGGASSLGVVNASGAVTASASGTGLTVNNNAVVGGALTVSGTGGVSLTGTNARLRFPATATGAGSNEGQMRYRAGQVEVWSGSTWLGSQSSGSSAYTSSFTGVNSTQNRVIVQSSIPDPGNPYHLMVAGQCEFNDVAVDTRWDLYIVLDSASNSDFITMGGGNGFTTTAMGVSPRLTGTHTLMFVARRVVGAGTVNITPFSQVWTAFQISSAV